MEQNEGRYEQEEEGGSVGEERTKEGEGLTRRGG